MPNITIKHIDEFDYFKGEKARPGIRFCYAGKGLGVTAWGMNVIKIDPNCTNYPEHDHAEDGQEEVYVVLKGKVTLKTDNEESELEQNMMVRVDPKQKRQFITGAEGAILLALGNTPGKAYKAADK